MKRSLSHGGKGFWVEWHANLQIAGEYGEMQLFPRQEIGRL